MSENVSDLRGRLLARQKRFRVRSKAVGNLVLVAIAFGLGLAVVPLWQHTGFWKPVASHAGSVIQAGWRDLFGAPAEDCPWHVDPDLPAPD